MVQVHYARFYKPKTKGINCMTLSNSKLALSRSDNSIEIWNIANTPFIEIIIPYTLEQHIQGLIWVKTRLFSCDLQGFLNEYDLNLLEIKSKLSVTGEAAYCLDTDTSNQHIAVGTDQGYINIFSISEENEVLFKKFLDKQEGKILCLKYDTTGNFIVTGSIDVIRIFDVNHGHALHKMSTGRSEKNKPTITWCLNVLSEFVIITGDSRGKLTFWDGKIGAQIETYQSHKADILSICVSENEDTIFCAGVDPIISSFAKVNVKDGCKWVKNIQRRVHDHDVKALIQHKNKLYSGGVDGYLGLSYHPPKTLVKYPSLYNDSVSLSETKMMLLRYSNYLEVWKLGESEGEVGFNQMYRIKNVPKKIAVIERQIKDSQGNKEREFILCCAISKDGRWICYSTISCVNLLELEYVDEKLKLSSTKLNDLCESCTRLGFTQFNELILITTEKVLIIYDLETKSLKNKFETIPHITNNVLLLTISQEYFSISDITGNAVVFKKDNKLWKFYWALPKYSCPIISMAIGPKSNLIVAYSDNQLSAYELCNKKIMTIFKSFNSTSLDHYRNKHLPIRNITFDLSNDNIIILHDDVTIVVINKDKIPSDESKPKIAKLDKVLSGNKTGIRTINGHQHLLYLEQISKKECVAVEVNPISFLSELPPCLKQTLFGKK
nr:U3 small nucleolar RNA-associated protein 4 homolog [Onthophagus taurus]